MKFLYQLIYEHFLKIKTLWFKSISIILFNTVNA